MATFFNEMTAHNDKLNEGSLHQGVFRGRRRL